MAMKLWVHLFKKDLFRLRLFLVLWMLALGFSLVAATLSSSVVAGDYVMLSAIDIAYTLSSILQLLLIGVLAPLLIHAEPFCGTDSFWQTRPIRSGDVLRSKALFILLVIVTFQIVVELISLFAAQVPLGYIGLAVPELIIQRTASVMVVVVCALLTRRFSTFVLAYGGWLASRFVLTGVLLTVRQFGKIPGLKELSASSSAADLVDSAILIVLCVLLMVHQVKTRRTARSFALLGVLLFVQFGVQNFAPFEVKLEPDMTPKIPQEELDDISVEPVLGTPYRYASDQPVTRPDEPIIKGVYVPFVLNNLPEGFGADAVVKSAQLSVSDDVINYQGDGVNTFGFYASNASKYMAMNTTLSPLNLVRSRYNASFFGVMAKALEMEGSTFNRLLGQRGTYQAEIDLAIYRYKKVSTIPAAVGAIATFGNTRLIVDSILEDSGGVRVLFREQQVHAVLARPTVEQSTLSERFAVFLADDETAVMGRPQSVDFARVLSRGLVRTLQRMWLFETRQGDEIRLADGKLQGRTLIVLEPEWLGVTTVEVTDDSFEVADSRRGFVSQPVKPVDLGTIVFPEEPTRENLKKYIRQVMAASSGRRSFSDRDPEVGMLVRVGEDNLDLLLDASVNSIHSFHLQYAIQRLVREKHKDLILKNLQRYPDLARQVMQFGWQKEVRETLLNELKYQSSLPTEWIKAVASFEDPETYPALLHYFVKGGNRQITYGIIKNLPSIELDVAVADAWNAAKYDHVYNRDAMIPIALEYGHVSALKSAIEALSDPEVREHYLKPIEKALRQYVGNYISTEALEVWFKENQESIRFDSSQQRFVGPHLLEESVYSAPDSDDVARSTVWNPKSRARLTLDLALSARKAGDTKREFDLYMKSYGEDPFASSGYAAFAIACIYDKGCEGVPQDKQKAFEWRIKGADAGHPECIINVIARFAKGNILGEEECDAEKAMHYTKKLLLLKKYLSTDDRCWDVIAATSARSGAFAEAIECQKKAIAVLFSEKNRINRSEKSKKREHEEMLKRVALYEEGKPFTYERTKAECGDFGGQTQKTREQRLAELELPENAAPAQVQFYIRKVLELQPTKIRYSDDSPFFKKLRAVGSENLEQLLMAADQAEHLDRRKLEWILPRMVAEENKALVLAQLAKYPFLATAVVKYGWQEEAKETLVNGLYGTSLPSDWIKAVALLEDPETYPLLLSYFEQCFSARSVFEIIKNLQGIDLKPSVARAWENAQYGSFHLQADMVPVVLSCGMQGGLEVAIEQLLFDPSLSESHKKSILKALTQYTGQSGSNAEVREWYRANKDDLRFDPETNMFVVSGED